MLYLFGAIAYLGIVSTLKLAALRRLHRSIELQTQLLRQQCETRPPNDDETPRGNRGTVIRIDDHRPPQGDATAIRWVNSHGPRAAR